MYDEKGAVEALSSMKIGGKTFIVDDQGSIRDQTGNIRRFDKVTVGDKPYYVDDNGTIYSNEAELGKLDEFGISDKDYDAKTGRLTDEGKAKLESIVGTLALINDKSVTITVDEVRTISTIYKDVMGMFHKDAAGGFYKLHASGGSFVTSGVTDLGLDRYGVRHIAGEAGREWVMRHADGTTSILPIQNRRYLEPYASTIASMIGPSGSTTTNDVRIVLQYDAGADAKTITRDIAREMKLQGLMG